MAELNKYFVGSFEHRLDAKGRVSLPAVFREALREQGSPSEFVLLPPDEKPCLRAMSQEGHHGVIRKLRDIDYESEEEEEATRQQYIAAARIVSVEDTGRFVLGREHRAAIGCPNGGDLIFRGDA
ncbi:MAG: MraZ N-terminal domain-containing protein, partial [Pseudomonadota bacterium]